MTTGWTGQAPQNTFPAKASRGDCGSVSVGAEVTGRGGLGWAAGGGVRVPGGSTCNLLTTVKLHHFHKMCLGVTKLGESERDHQQTQKPSLKSLRNSVVSQHGKNTQTTPARPPRSGQKRQHFWLFYKLSCQTGRHFLLERGRRQNSTPSLEAGFSLTH